MLIKAYFDCGNQPDSTRYEIATLASIVGRNKEWRSFEREWKEILRAHRASSLHTTDAVALKRDFADGWNEDRRNRFIEDCVSLIRRSMVEPHSQVVQRHGLFPYVISIDLADFKKAQLERPDVIRDATEMLALPAFDHALRCFKHLKGDFVDVIGDLNEPYIGHLTDRRNNPKFRKDLLELTGIDMERRISKIGSANSRHVPALQAADLIAWCVSHKANIKFGWQQTILDMDRNEHSLEYPHLSEPNEIFFQLNRLRYKFPPRRSSR